MGRNNRKKGGGKGKNANHNNNGNASSQPTSSTTTQKPTPSPTATTRTPAAPSTSSSRPPPPLTPPPATEGRRNILLMACLGYFIQRYMNQSKHLYPFGTAGPMPEHKRPKFKTVDLSNDQLLGKHGKLTKIYERLLDNSTAIEQEPLIKGPETVVIHPKDGTIYVLTEEALLVSLTDLKPHTTTTADTTEQTASIMTAKATKVVDLGMGRPLGGRFTIDGKTLYVADAILGLLRVVHPHQFPKSKVEVVASQVVDYIDDEKPIMTPILYANDVAIGPKTGKVYFTDSTDVIPDRVGTRTWDTMYAAKTDLVRGKRRGRLLEYDPHTNQVKVLAKNLWFANGIGIDKEERFIFLAETFALRLVKVHLTGDQQGKVEALVDSHDMTGYPDGADCGIVNNKELCFGVMPSLVLQLIKLLYQIPHPFDVVVRNTVMALPKKLVPKIKPYGGIVQVDPETKEIQYYQDPEAEEIGHLAGVTVWNNKLYLGSLKNNFVGVYDLN